MNDRTYTIMIGGKAGEGVKKAAQVCAEILIDVGRFVFQMDDYQSLIKGGHNFSILSCSTSPVHSTYQRPDLLICFDKRSYEMHIGETKPDTLIIFNGDEMSSDRGIALPFGKLLKKLNAPQLNISSVPIAILCAILGMDESYLESKVKKHYKREYEKNYAIALEVYRLCNRIEAPFSTSPKLSGLRLYSGNQLIALGAWAAGLDMYFSYPMTPASSILHFLASKQQELGLIACHTESELAAINMAIGATFAGSKAAVGSSGGGFALMQEAFSMAAMTEAPLLCILSSRPGPATGVSTYTAQEDLNFALNQGHGEFGRIVASPDSYERAFSLSSELLALAWEFQIPVILLTEKHLSESIACVQIDPDTAVWAEEKLFQHESKYERYEICANGISPLLYPPSEEVIKWNSHEHLPSGLRTDTAANMIKMKEKRLLKDQGILRGIKKYSTYSVYGSGSRIVFAYGSSVLELREAMKLLDDEIMIVAPIFLEPFDEEAMASFKACPAIVVEHSTNASFAKFLQSKLQINVLASILKYDGRPFDPIDLAQKIEEVFNA